MSRHKRSTFAAGFTLVELLVVMGIIGTLIGLLMPTFSAARRESRKTVCKSQLQQLGYAVQMYLNHNKARYPRAPSLPSVNPNNLPTIMENLDPYIAKDRRVFHCPADEKLFRDEGTSYFYYAELGEHPLAETVMWNIYRDVTRVPILWDGDSFHGGGVPFNWLFLDGHVDHLLTPAQ